MRRLPFLKAIALFIVFISAESCSKEFKQTPLTPQNTASLNSIASSKPNIILIIADDVGREIPTYNGGQSYSTPNLDFMAANGMQFPYFFSHPDGPPSRLALITGKYNYRNWIKFGYLPLNSTTFANMLKSTGYETCYVGKWQLDGGNSSIIKHGFNKYLVYMPFDPSLQHGHDQYYRRYKNPYLYENGSFLTNAQVEGKYSEDMFFDYASKFIDSNKTNPFLMVYANNLVQEPWTPTPDDPEFAAWKPGTDDTAKDNISYFPSMVKYMDKIIGKLINKVQTAGIAQNTLIMFISDNATNPHVQSIYKGKRIIGSKDATIYSGINVPCLAYMPGKVAPGAIDTSLVDMTDFFPTFAALAKTSDAAYKPLDGTSFYDNLIGAIDPNKQRSTVYCYWPRDYQQKIDLSYVLNYKYKLYDSLNGGKFFNIKKDSFELHPLSDRTLTGTERKTKTEFKQELRQAF